MRRYLEEARGAFRGSAVMRQACNDYEREVAEGLREERLRTAPAPAHVGPPAPGLAEGVAAEVNRRLAEARAPRSPNAFTAAEVRALAVGYLASYDRSAVAYTAQPHWHLWLAEARPRNALFAALIFYPDDGVEFLCGTGHAADIMEYVMWWHEGDEVARQLSANFTVPGGRWDIRRSLSSETVAAGDETPFGANDAQAHVHRVRDDQRGQDERPAGENARIARLESELAANPDKLTGG